MCAHVRLYAGAGRYGGVGSRRPKRDTVSPTKTALAVLRGDRIPFATRGVLEGKALLVLDGSRRWGAPRGGHVVGAALAPGVEELDVALEQVEAKALRAVVPHPLARLQPPAGEYPTALAQPLLHQFGLLPQGSHRDPESALHGLAVLPIPLPVVDREAEAGARCPILEITDLRVGAQIAD